MDTILSGKIRNVTVIVVDSVFTIKAPSHLELLIENIFNISFELRIGGKCCKFSCVYRSPSQTQDEFETFLKNFEPTLDKIH